MEETSSDTILVLAWNDAWTASIRVDIYSQRHGIHGSGIHTHVLYDIRYISIRGKPYTSSNNGPH